MKGPLCSIVIPCRNEAGAIEKCLESIFSSDHTPLEVLIADGMSDDDTEEVIRQYMRKWPERNIKILKNRKLITPAGINIGFTSSSGEYISLVGAHNFISQDYISTAIRNIEEGRADCVGGKGICLPSSKGVLARVIALVLNSKFGVGPSFRTLREAKYIDTVPCPVYRKDVIQKIGLFDEELIRNQDDEFNMRLIKAGGRILLEPGITMYYYARDSLSKLFKMYYQYGYFKPLVIKRVGRFTFRQLVPPLFCGGLLMSVLFSPLSSSFFGAGLFLLSTYMATALLISGMLSLRNGLAVFPLMPLAFAAVHFGYGLGYLKGIMDFLLIGKKVTNIKLTR